MTAHEDFLAPTAIINADHPKVRDFAHGIRAPRPPSVRVRPLCITRCVTVSAMTLTIWC